MTVIKKVTICPTPGIGLPDCSVLTVTKLASSDASSGSVSDSLLPVLGSWLIVLIAAAFLNSPAALMVAVTVITPLLPLPMDGILQGKAVHDETAPVPLTPVIVRLVGVSVITTDSAADGPAFETLI